MAYMLRAVIPACGRPSRSSVSVQMLAERRKRPAGIAPKYTACSGQNKSAPPPPTITAKLNRRRQRGQNLSIAKSANQESPQAITMTRGSMTVRMRLNQAKRRHAARRCRRRAVDKAYHAVIAAINPRYSDVANAKPDMPQNRHQCDKDPDADYIGHRLPHD